MFFVLSGYLITTLLLGARDSSLDSGGARAGISWRFGVRRVLRLFPAYYLVILVALALGVRGIVELWPWHPTLGGKHSYGLGMAARDVLRGRSPRNRGRQPLSDSLEEAFTQQRFEAVILSKRTDFPGFRDNYRRSRRIESPAPVTGSPYHPREVWVPKLPDAGGLPQGSTPDTR